MARPIKDGVDYFPFDVDFFQDKKIRILKSEFGLKGIAVLIALFCEIYRTHGYYLKWDDDDCFIMADAVGCGCTPEHIKQVVQGCLRRSVFDDRVFQVFGVLTSAGIQRRYIRMFNSRTSITIIREYWLLNNENLNDVPTGVLDKITFFSVSGTENAVSGTENPDKNTENPLKEKENKIKESKGKEIYQKVCDLFNETCVSFPRVTALSEKRKKAISARLNAGYTLEDFAKAFQLSEQSSFLKGKNSRDWRATFDWIIKDANMAKILDGNYQDRNPREIKIPAEEDLPL